MQPEDWYSINLTELQEVGFPTSVTKIQLAELLKEKYPNYELDKIYYLRGKFAQQKRLERAATKLFAVSTTTQHNTTQRNATQRNAT